MPINRFGEVQPFYSRIPIIQASSTNFVQATIIGATPHRVDMVIAVSTSANAKYVTLEVYIGATGYTLGSVEVPAGAGYTTVPAVQLLPALLPSTIDGLAMAADVKMRAAVDTALGAGETLTLVLVGGYC